MCTPSPPKAPPPEPQRQPRYLLSRDQFEELGVSAGGRGPQWTPPPDGGSVRSGPPSNAGLGLGDGLTLTRGGLQP